MRGLVSKCYRPCYGSAVQGGANLKVPAGPADDGVANPVAAKEKAKAKAKRRADAPLDDEQAADEQAVKESAAEELPANQQVPKAQAANEQRIVGLVKWFDATRGFGFVISDQCEGDVLVHFSVLRDHGRRSLPEGATVECVVARHDRGMQATEILSIDLSTALPIPARPARSGAERPDRDALAEAAGSFEPVEVKWFNRVKGYGFLNRVADDVAEAADVFVHMETVREAEIADLQPGQRLEARIAEGRKGLTAIEVREA